jgi:DNA-binding transcriptional ArsR family regulator
MSTGLEQIDDVLAALADPMRRTVLGRIAASGRATATVLAAELPVSRQAVVQHLAFLERVGLVESRRSGRERHYTVQPEPLTATADWMLKLASQWDTRLAAIKALAESPVPSPAQSPPAAPVSPASPVRSTETGSD